MQQFRSGPFLTINLHTTVLQVWKELQTSMLTQLQIEEEPLILGGDGRSDSPGFSAKYGAYTFMDITHNVVLNMELIQVKLYSNSNYVISTIQL